MKKTGNIIIASVLSALICLSCGAMATASASAAEIGSTSAQTQQAYMPILREGVWQAVGLNGKSDYFEVRNSFNTIYVMSAENKIGLPNRFEYNRATGTYSVIAGAPGRTETWQLTSNNGSLATLSTSNGQSFSLFYLGPGSAKDVYSLNQIGDMAKNYFAARFGSANDVCLDTSLRADGSGCALVVVYARDTMRQVVVDTYNINVITGVGTNNDLHIIDFAHFA